MMSEDAPITTEMLENLRPKAENQSPSTREEFDVVIVGAGISGINTAYRIQTELPSTNYTIFEARDALGGTWDFFKYPGLRSDSDLYTFGFSWRPWLKNNPIADAKSILDYLVTSTYNVGIHHHIQLKSRVQKANWSTKSQTWELIVASERTVRKVRAKFLVLGTGYYDYETPLTTVIPGRDCFAGKVVHTQFWPEDLDLANKRVVCIGSGATAITLVPVLAQKAAGVTMLQRSPSYIISLDNTISDSSLWRYIPTRLLFILRRWYFIVFPMLFYYFCRLFPVYSRNMIKQDASKQLPKGYPIDPDFNPRYNPFDQRVCFAPDGDFYAAIRSGRAKVVTGSIQQVVEDGVVLESGTKIEADIIITATGLRLQLGGAIQLTVDGQPYYLNDKFMWHNAMLEDLPNAVLITGYTMASWTLGADTTALLLCRLLRGMQTHTITSIVPRMTEGELVKPSPLLALNSTYVVAASKVLPKAGDRGPWRRRMNYLTDYVKFKYGNVSNGLESYREDFLVKGVRF